MKKFLIFSSIFLVAVICVISTLCFVKPTLKFTHDAPQKIYAYDNSSVAIQNGENGTEFTAETITYRELYKRFNDMFKISSFTYLVHGNSVKPVITQDINNTYPRYNTLQNKTYSISLFFENQQHQVVQDSNGHTKLIDYYAILVILNYQKIGYQQVPIYFRTDSAGTSYSEAPMLAYANTKKLVEYIQQM